MPADYKPVSCSFYDALLDRATSRKTTELSVAPEDGQGMTLSGVIADVYAKAGSEYLRLQDGAVVRLDHIVSVDGRKVQDTPE